VKSLGELEEIAIERFWTEEQFELAKLERFGEPIIQVELNREVGVFSRYCELISSDWGPDVASKIEDNVRETYTRLSWKNQAISDKNRTGYGLVVGRIQSGKTAHIIGLSMLALDKFENKNNRQYDTIIVLSGLLNDLRKQTYQRIANLGIDNIRLFPKDADFSEKNDEAKSELLEALCKAEPCILVVKKNHNVIEAILGYLDESEIKLQIPERRILLIDDECDHASIDSGHAESDEKIDEVTATNWAVRKLILSLQASKDTLWYIGYTATPYSNLLMHPEPEFLKIRDLGSSLFPRDMIHLLPRPEGHHDNQFFFKANGKPYICEKDIPGIGSSEERQHLRELVILHVVSKILRECEGSVKHHTTMIHTDTETDEHKRMGEILRDIIEQEFEGLSDIEANDLITEIGKIHYPDELELLQNECNKIIGSRHLSLEDYFTDIDIVLFNADKEKEKLEHNYISNLPYHTKKEVSIIVIGGHKLSRGLTVEGLTITWFARFSKKPNYDTMLQMARWCGYRGEFLELIRIFMTSDSIQHYQFITEVERRLRIDLKRFTKHTNPLDEIQWIRQYHGMSISGKLPNNLTQKPSSSSTILSEFILDELPDKYSNLDSKLIQSKIFQKFKDLILFHDGEFSPGRGGFDVAKTTFNRIEELIHLYLNEYGKNPNSKKYLESLLNIIHEEEDLNGQWNLSIYRPDDGPTHPEYNFKLSQLGFKVGGKNHISAPELTAVSDLQPGTTHRINPMMCIFVEDPSLNIAGIPTYNDNSIPIVIIGFFIPHSSLPPAYIEIARPDIEILEEEE